MNNSQYYSRLIESTINPGNAKKSGTFRAWQDMAIRARKALQTVRADYDDADKELIGTYTSTVYLQKKAELDAKYNAVVDDVKKKLTDSLDSIIESKRQQFDRCSGAPSAEDLRLLQALSMRSSLTIAEVANVVGKLNGNVQSLAVLRDVAEKHGIHVPTGATTPEEFDASLERARNFSIDRLNEIDVPIKESGYKARAFYDYPDHRGEASHLYTPLDANQLTTEQISEATRQAQQAAARAQEPEVTPAAAKTGEGDVLPMWAEVTVANEYLSTIARQFHTTTDEIKRANPNKDFDHGIRSGEKILVPSTHFSYEPDQTGSHVQPDRVRAVPAPQYVTPAGPNGEEIGQDISIT